MKADAMDEIAKKRLKTLYFSYLAAVLLIFVITVLVGLLRPLRFAAIGLPPFEPQPLMPVSHQLSRETGMPVTKSICLFRG